MFARKTQSLSDEKVRREIREILSGYSSLAQSDASIFRLLLPPKEIWRYFVESTVVESGSQDWRDFEKREPGYLRALYSGFHEVFNLKNELNIDFILHLHRLSTESVEGLNYSKVDLQRHTCTGPGLFRHCTGVAFGINKYNNATQDGIYEFIKRNHRFTQLELNSFPLTDGNVLILRESYRHLKQKYERITVRRFYQQLREISFVADLPEAVIKKNIPVLLDIAKSSDDRELARCLFMKTSTQFDMDIKIKSRLHSSGADGILINEIKNYLDEYRSSLSKSRDPATMLFAIITLVQSCEQLHPFSDANCRTFCMLLLNHLLMKNGFPPALLENPNRFDAFSKAELLDDLLYGMKASLQLAQGKLDSCVKTDNLLRKDSTLKRYFEETTSIEESHRKRQPKRVRR